jgi:hypothetical protein
MSAFPTSFLFMPARLELAMSLHMTYHATTDPKVIAILERLRGTATRIHVHYGSTDPDAADLGTDWGGIYDHEGRVGCSWGPKRIPLLLARRDSVSGGGMLDHCIVRIRYANQADGGDLYRHPNYHMTRDTVDGLSDAQRDRHFPGWRDALLATAA